MKRLAIALLVLVITGCGQDQEPNEPVGGSPPVDPEARYLQALQLLEAEQEQFDRMNVMVQEARAQMDQEEAELRAMANQISDPEMREEALQKVRTVEAEKARQAAETIEEMKPKIEAQLQRIAKAKESLSEAEKNR